MRHLVFKYSKYIKRSHRQGALRMATIDSMTPCFPRKRQITPVFVLWGSLLFSLCSTGCLAVSESSVQTPTYPDFTQIAEQYSPAVVNISTTRKVKSKGLDNLEDEFGDSPYGDIFRKFFFGFPMEPREYQSESLGSGTIISSDGYILTNNHVIKEASEILVHLSDKREFRAKVVGADESTDLALLKIKTENLPVVKLGRSKDIKVGEWVLAIGSPFGFEHSVTAGIVSGIHRSIGNERSVPFIQTDAAINPGNSGGPLFNLRGEVIGINAQILSKSGGYLGLSFSIPIDLATDVVKQLKEHGVVSHGWLGIAFQEVDSNLAQSFGLDRPYGALVAQVVPGSPAEKSGLKTGDVLIRFNGQDISEATELPQLVGQLKPGEKVEVTFIRQKKQMSLKVEIGENKNGEKNGKNGDAVSSYNRLGLKLRALNAEEKRVYTAGVAIASISPQSPLLRLGVRLGDVIVALDQKPIPDVKAFDKLLAQYQDNQIVPILLSSHKGQMSRYIAIKLPPAERSHDE